MHSLKNAHARVVLTPQPIATASQSPSRVTIGIFSDEVLLNIFSYFLDVSPRYWPRLVHICRRWRFIVFGSQRVLHLQLLCTQETPVLDTLGCWPATLPIAVQYGGSLALDLPGPEEEDNIMTALMQSDRVSSINLTVTSSLLNKLSAIERPFSELEDLILLSWDSVPLILPRAFQWGPCLRRLHLTRIASPSLLQLLHSSKNLVDLQLYEVHNPRNILPEDLADALSGMVQLRSLSLHFLFTADHTGGLPTLWKRVVNVVIPALTHLNFRGSTKYLADLVAIIDAPRLEIIELTFLNKSIFDLPKLSEFINRIEMHKLHRQADILLSERAISITLTRPGTSTSIKLHIFCELNVQLSFLAQVHNHFSAFLFNVEDLRISATGHSMEKWSGREPWRFLLNPFSGVKRFHVAGNHSTDILRALQLPMRQRENVLPALHKLLLAQPGPHLREAVVSFIVSRRLSGHTIALEYERYEPLCYLSEPGREGPEEPISPEVAIEMLSDDIILNIFHHYLDTTPQIWPTLVWVCQRWRQIVFASPLGLNLRLYCTYGTPVFKTLDFWPALPIFVKYGGFPNLDPPTSEDDENIIFALKQSGRVSSICLTITDSLLERLSAISEPLAELEQLVLLSRDNMQPPLPSTFRWGPRLRTLQSTRIALPSIPQLLLRSHDLVDIQLQDIPSAGYFSPDAFANALSGMNQLEILSLLFSSLPPGGNYVHLPPLLRERIVLPALTRLKYRGTSKYLDSLVAWIDAPHLRDIDITLFNQTTMDTSGLGRFIEQIETQASLNEGNVRTSADAFTISFTSSSSQSSSSTPLRLQISCQQPDWQLFSMAQVCVQFSPFLRRVESVSINTNQSPSGQVGVDGGQWLELFRSFSGATDFRVVGGLAIDILSVLVQANGGHPTVFPSLRHLRVENPKAVKKLLGGALCSFINSRSLSGRPVQVNVPFHLCDICHTSFSEQKVLDRHLQDEHAYRIVCSHCGDFECTPGQNHLFLEHFEDEHPEVARNAVPISDIVSRLQIDRLVEQHSSLRAPGIADPPPRSWRRTPNV